MTQTGDQQKDCLECRLVSGFGVIGLGCYVFVQAKKRKKLEANVIKVISAGTIFVGVARLLNMSFLKASSKRDS